MKLDILSAWLVAGLTTASAAVIEPQQQQPIGARPADHQSAASPPATGNAAAGKPSAAAPSYRDALLSLHKSIVSTKSVTGTEAAVGDVLVDYLTERGFVALKQPVAPHERTPKGSPRFNVIAWPRTPSDSYEDGHYYFKKAIPSAKVVLSSHIDVVPPHIPYRIDAASPDQITADTVIHGRGSDDAKASVASQIIALEEILAEGVAGANDTLLVYVVGEEEGGDGMATFSEYVTETHTSFGSVIFGEPTENKLACGHKGILSCYVHATGQAGHSGYPWLGKSANELLMRGLVAVLDADLGSSLVFGNTTVNVGRMSGGVAGNVIPASADAQLAIRVALGPEASGHEVVRERLVKALASVDAEALHAECPGGYGSVACNCKVDGFETITVNYGTDVPNLKGDHTRYLYGPGTILVAHSDHETVTVGQLEEAVEGYKKLIKHTLA